MALQLLELDKLNSESWFWPGATKLEISKALDGKPDGTFVVRDATSPGDFTLTVRARGETKLVKITVMDGKCGFNPQALDYSSVQELIGKYANESLKAYNANLDTMLTNPLRDPKRRKSGDEDFDKALAVERFRITKCAFMRATKIYDQHHGEQIRAENLLKTEQNALLDIRKKEKWLEIVSRQQLEVIEEAADVKGDGDTVSTAPTTVGVAEERRMTAFQGNAKMIASLQRELRSDAAVVEEHMQKLRAFMKQHEQEMVKESERLTMLSSSLEGHIALLRGTGRDGKIIGRALLTEEKLTEISDKVEHMRQNHETMQVARILNELTLNWDPSRFLVNDPSKESAAAFIEAARLRLLAEWKKNEGTNRKRSTGSEPSSSTSSSPSSQAAMPNFDGIFLVRPSASVKGMLVLSVLHGGRVSHCLIEEAEHGWGFKDGGLYFVSIGDFVRYYANNSLEEHNKNIRTILTEPVLPP